MALDPHAKRFLDLVAAVGVRDIARLTPAEVRRGFLDLAKIVDVKNVAVGGIENTTLPGPAGPLRARIYTPVEADPGPGPGMVYFHGGGGVFCDLDTHDGFCRLLANASGCRIVSVEYRLAPEHRFPAAIDDGCAAAAFVADHAGQFAIDPDRLAIGGDSAGGNLAAVVCQLARDAGRPKFALQVLFCPVTDLGADNASRAAFADGYFVNREMLAWTLMHYGGPEADVSDPKMSPLRAADFAGLPPTHIHTAEFDPLRDEGEAYADRLAGAGVDVSYTCHSGMIHHFYAMAAVIPYARTAVTAAGAAVRAALA